MVRLKHRYLLVNILYPQSKSASKTTTSGQEDELPYSVQFHRPSSDSIDTRFLLKLIRDGVAELFGDYGSGMIAGSLKSMLTFLCLRYDSTSSRCSLLTADPSQLLFTSNVNSYHPRFSRSL